MTFGTITAVAAAGLSALGRESLALGYRMHYIGDWGGGWWIARVLIMVIFWVAVIALIVWAVRSFAGQKQQQQQQQYRTPLDIARERLAKGEISHEEFESIKRELM
jgi:putative membrane protein